MKFSVGYQFKDEYGESFAEDLCELRDYVSEVYFPSVKISTCRAPLPGSLSDGRSAQNVLEHDLVRLKENGIRLNLLLNANCYGMESLSKKFKEQICSVVGHVEELCGLDSVTTTSSFVAHVLKTYFPSITVRASVNMCIGTIKGMEYLSDLFDGFYLQRDYNRDLQYIQTIKRWCDDNGKMLYFLANSGCMRFCSGQIFHDNLVSHESQIRETDNVKEFCGAACWRYYEKGNWVSLLQNTWVRPEDISNYESLFDTVKLATRMTSHPLRVVMAYINGSYNGNLLDLLEPNHTPALQGHYISNRRFPSDWFRHTSTCGGMCNRCDYCNETLRRVLLDTRDIRSLT